MSTDSKRDQSTDRMLKAALRQRSADVRGDACVDAETFAAWADGALAEAEAQRVEAHLADCARCQSLMAAFAAGEPAAASGVMAAAPADAPVVVPFRPRSPMQTIRWLVPAAAATIAATLLIWTAWPRPNATLVGTDQTMAKAEPTTAPSAAAPAPTSAAPVPEFGPMRPSSVAAQPRDSASRLASPRSTAALADEARKEQKATAELTLQARQGLTASQQMARQEQVQRGARADAAKPVASPPPAAAPPPPPTYMPPPLPPPIGAATARSSTVAGLPQSSLNVSIPIAVIVEFAPPDSPVRGAVGMGRGGGGGGRGGAGGGRARAAMAAERAIPRVRWRIMTSGQVEKSIDAGLTWLPVVLDPPAAVGNGAAPSADVCWLVGRAGIVLLSTDGAKFTRVPFPEATDLRSIAAIDARQATVTAVDGRVFTTSDAGLTWK